MWVAVCVVIVGFFGPLGLMVLRWRRIRRYGVGGGEFNQPFATIGDGGVPPGTVIQEDFGDVATTQTEAAIGEPNLADGQRWAILDRSPNSRRPSLPRPRAGDGDR